MLGSTHVLFGFPSLIKANIELTLRSNPVVFLGDNESLPYQEFLKENTPSVVFADLHSFIEEADSFATIFKHFSHDDSSPVRQEYELNCFRRWFILKQYMIANKLSRVFYSDSDSVILRFVCSVFIHITCVHFRFELHMLILKVVG